MATESRRDGRSIPFDSNERSRAPSFQRRDPETGVERRSFTIAAAVQAELSTARTLAQALESRPRTRCRVSQVVTSRWGVIDAADEVLGLMLQRLAKSLIGLPFSSLIAGPERRIFGERARLLLEASDASEWETRIIAPGARIGIPVAISVERAGENSLRWYIRDLTELRRAQARVMELEAITLAS
jgi:hypothetical protein